LPTGENCVRFAVAATFVATTGFMQTAGMPGLKASACGKG